MTVVGGMTVASSGWKEEVMTGGRTALVISVLSVREAGAVPPL